MLAIIKKCLSLLDATAKRRWMLLVLLALAAAMLEISGTAIIFALINIVNDPTHVASVPLIGGILVWFVERVGNNAIVLFSIVVALYFAAKNAFLLFEIYYREKCAVESAALTAQRLMRAYLMAPYAFYFQNNSSDMIRNLETSVDATFRTVLLSAAAILSECLVVFGVLSVLVAAEPWITIIAGSTIGFVGGAILAIMRLKVTNWGARMSVLRSSIVQSIQQGIGSIKEIKVLGREELFLSRFAEANMARAQLTRLYTTISNAPRLAMETLLVAGLVLVIAVIVAQEGQTGAAIPVIGLFAYAGFRIVPSVNRVILHLNNIRFGSAFVDNIIDAFHQTASHARLEDKQSTPLEFQKAIRLDDISYCYPKAHRNSLDHINLEIAKGSAIGIVGSTGAGKSTLADVLLGLLHPDKGRLVIDGTDVTANPRPWQQKIGYVPQAIYLTDDTIRANIAFGIPPAQINETQLLRAAELAHIRNFIEELPEKFDTWVGERGIRLSGGQRQRIGIARALYHEPELLVFDEATSALDNETEAEIGHAIETLAGIKTIVLIAHRLSSLRACSTLVMMQDGQIIAKGSYDQLLETCPTFRQLAQPKVRGQVKDSDQTEAQSST